MKTRTAFLVVILGIGIFVAAEIGKRDRPGQTPGTPIRVARYADAQVDVKAESALPTDPTAKQRAIDAELNRAIKRAIDVELNRAIERALSEASEDDSKASRDW
ncbi:MAG: hypothetical protein WB586_01480 [Chthoniobacterales bacterium]